jgi:hypothetical protein
MPLEEAVARHYAGLDRVRVIPQALRAAGKDTDRLSIDDLASPLAEFHIRGREATVELDAAFGLGADQHLLDVGSGIGGSSRYFAHTYRALAFLGNATDRRRLVPGSSRPGRSGCRRADHRRQP